MLVICQMSDSELTDDGAVVVISGPMVQQEGEHIMAQQEGEQHITIISCADGLYSNVKILISL